VATKKPPNLSRASILEYSKQILLKIWNPVEDNKWNYISLLKKQLNLSFVIHQSHKNAAGY